MYMCITKYYMQDLVRIFYLKHFIIDCFSKEIDTFLPQISITFSCSPKKFKSLFFKHLRVIPLNLFHHLFKKTLNT